MRPKILNVLKITTLAVLLSLGITYVYAWVGPTATPPNNNAAAPINVSATAQTKAGDLTVAGGRVRSWNNPTEGGVISLTGNNGLINHLEGFNGIFRLVDSPWTKTLFQVDQAGNTWANGDICSNGAGRCLSQTGLNTIVGATNGYGGDSAWQYATAYCPVGYHVTGCSGTYNVSCYGGWQCDYHGSYPNGNGCSAFGVMRGGGTLVAYAYCGHN